MKEFEKLHKKFPFLSLGITKEKERIVGLILNRTKSFIGIYVLDTIEDLTEKKRFLELGEIWWWESNRMLPISVFLKAEIEPFRYALRNFTVKEIEIMVGPVTSLAFIAPKRIKRKTVNLVTKAKKEKGAI